jgi:integrase
MFNETPNRVRLAPPWNMQVALDFLASTDFNDLSCKTAFLLSAVTARRSSEVRALTVAPGHIVFGQHGVELTYGASFLPKNQTLSFSLEPLFVPVFKEGCSQLCPVGTLKQFLRESEKVRPEGTVALFVTTKGPVRAASRTTIARWIVDIIKRAYRWAGQDQPVHLHAHQVRAVSSSWALFQGVQLDRIMGAAGWKSETSFINSYLRDMAGPRAEMGRAVLQAASSAN